MWSLSRPAPVRAVKHVVDGTSRTWFAIERAAYVGMGDNGVGLSCASLWFNNWQAVSGISYPGSGPSLSGSGGLFVFATQVSPNYGINPCPPGRFCPLWPLWYASSFHPGGAHALNADGSVQFVNDSVDQRIIDSMTSIAALDNTGQ